MGLTSVSPGELHRLLGTEPVVAIDVNPRAQWLQARVPGALNLDPLAFTDGDLPRDKDAALVFYCSNFMCRKAPAAARRATGLGYVNVRVMSAGISGWLSAKLPTHTGEPAVRPV
jgi:rhodanese-related sulfurtransferase